LICRARIATQYEKNKNRRGNKENVALITSGRCQLSLLPVSTTLAANFSTIFASVVDTGGKQWEQLSNC
jgi:hypothetical protein